MGFDEEGKRKDFNGRNLKKNDEEWRVLERERWCLSRF